MIKAIGFDDAGITRARQLGAQKFRRAPVAVSYKPEADTVTITMPSGALVIIPRRWIIELPDMPDVPKAAFKTVKLGVDRRSFDLDEYDVKISAFGLLRHAVMGEDPYARAGSATSPAKARAARRNGAKGGRPKRHRVRR
jgi:hypothetical protein